MTMQRSSGLINLSSRLENEKSNFQTSEEPPSTLKSTRKSLSASKIPNPSRKGASEVKELPKKYIEMSPLSFDTKAPSFNTSSAGGYSRIDEMLASSAGMSTPLPRFGNEFPQALQQQNQRSGRVSEFILKLEESSPSRISPTDYDPPDSQSQQRIGLKKVKPLLSLRSSVSSGSAQLSKDKGMKRPASGNLSQDEPDGVPKDVTGSPKPPSQSQKIHNLLLSNPGVGHIGKVQQYLLKPAVKSLNYTQSESSLMSSSLYHHRQHLSNLSNNLTSNPGGSVTPKKATSTTSSASSGTFPVIIDNRKKYSSSSVHLQPLPQAQGHVQSNLEPEKPKHSYNHLTKSPSCSCSSAPNTPKKNVRSKNTSTPNLLKESKDTKDAATESSNSDISKKHNVDDDLAKQIKSLIKDNIALTKKLAQFQAKEGRESPLEKVHIPPKMVQSSRELTKKDEKTSDKMESLKYLNEKLREENKALNLENQKTSKLLRNILYTLNARGFETLSDGYGNLIDLNRCKGESLLEMKGRDTRNRAGVRKNSPQELLLKAVIGSQERLIQNLVSQMDNNIDQRERNLISPEPERGDVDGRTHSALESELLGLINVIEATCMRSPEVFNTLKSQLEMDYRERNSPNVLLENVIERCEKYLNVNSQHQTRAPPTPTPSPTSRSRCTRKKSTDKVPQQSQPQTHQPLSTSGTGRSPRSRPVHKPLVPCHIPSPIIVPKPLSGSVPPQRTPPPSPSRSNVNRPFPTLPTWPLIKMVDMPPPGSDYVMREQPPYPPTAFPPPSSCQPLSQTCPPPPSPRTRASNKSLKQGCSLVQLQPGKVTNLFSNKPPSSAMETCHFCNRSFDPDTPPHLITQHYESHQYQNNYNSS